MAYRNELETLRMHVSRLEGEIARLTADNAELAESARLHQELDFDPATLCPHCGGPVEAGVLFGGKGLIGWKQGELETRFGFAIGIEWLREPAFLLRTPIPLRGLRCRSCRRLFLDY